MTIAVDTNLLVRLFDAGDPAQTDRVIRELDAATAVSVSIVVLCEFVWVMRAVYRTPRGEIAALVRSLIAHPKVRTDTASAALGLACLEAGGDFADGVIAAQGVQAGALAFVTFDRQAAAILAPLGVPARPPAD